jgi:hypothetical protein
MMSDPGNGGGGVEKVGDKIDNVPEKSLSAIQHGNCQLALNSRLRIYGVISFSIDTFL